MTVTHDYTCVEPVVATANDGTIGGSRAFYPPPWLPSPLLITGAQIWGGFQNPALLLPGQWQLGVDRGGRYTNGTGYPALQACPFGDPRCWEQNQVLAQFQSLEGHTPEYVGKYETYSTPIEVNPGDKLFFDSLAGYPSGAPTIQMIWRLTYIDGAAPSVPTVSSWSTAWSATLTSTNNSGNIAMSLRHVIPISAGGSYVRATFNATPSYPYTVRYASVGVWSGTGCDTVDDPVELTFQKTGLGPQSGFQISANTSITSNPVPLSTTSGQSLVLTIDVDPATSYDLLGSVGVNYTYFLRQSTYALGTPKVGQGIQSGSQAYARGVTKIEVGT